MIEHLRRLYVHLAWADDEVLQSLRGAQGRTDRARQLFAHLLAAEHVWIARLRGETPQLVVWPELSLEECAKIAAANRSAYAAFVGSLDDAALARVVHYRNSAGREFDSSVDEILLHVCLHGAYHRGQVALLLRDEGDVPATDYIAFVRGVPAATRGPA